MYIYHLSTPEMIGIIKWYAMYQNTSLVARKFRKHYSQTLPMQKFHETEIGEDRSRSVITDEKEKGISAIFRESTET